MMKNIELKNPEIDADGLIVQYSVSVPKEDQSEDKIIQEFYADYRSTLDELERLTNNADGLDYALAASSGLIAGIIDIFFVGELGLFKNASDEAKDRFRSDKGEINEKVNRYIEKYAKRKGYKGEGLKGAIDFLEKKYPVAQDNVWSGKHISSANTHHLDDLAHHPTLLGLLSAIVVQYFRLAVFSNKQGSDVVVFVEIDKKEFIRNLIPIVISGVLKWLTYMVEQKEKNELDEELPKPIHILVEKLYLTPAAISILKTVDNWYGHLVSDMGGSKNTPGGGTGIPGMFLSLMKEISMLPGLNNSNLPQLLNDLYQGTAASPLTDKLDLRAELTVVKEQQLPVIVNEILVRSSYFISHLVKELQDNDLQNVNWKNVVPFYNRTTVRMMTVSTVTMEVVDAADAAIRAAAKSGGFVPGFAAQFVVRINFVGLGRCALACTTDAAMGLKKTSLEYAVASAEVGIASDVTMKALDDIQLSKQKTQKKLDELNAQTSELSGFKF